LAFMKIAFYQLRSNIAFALASCTTVILRSGHLAASRRMAARDPWPILRGSPLRGERLRMTAALVVTVRSALGGSLGFAI
jgi:hypothetical protein